MSQLPEQLKKNNPGAFSVLQSMVNYLFILDFKGRTLLTSQSVLEDTERDQSFYATKSFDEYLIDDNNSFNLIDSFLLNAPQKNIELNLKHRNQPPIPVMLLSTTLLKEFFNKEDLIFVLCTDLRLQKKTQATLLQSNKMASLGEMSSSLAHELNNPLTIMDGQLRRLQDYIYDEEVTKEETVELIEKTQRSLGRAVKIIKTFRSISRKGDTDPFVSTPLQEIISEISELTIKRLESNSIDFKILCSDNMISLNCRKSSLLQVFINIINNAIDAISESDEKWVKLHIMKKNNNVIFTIMDSGEGVSVENQIRLFEPFFTTKDIGKGTGLGLSISRTIIEEHNGSLYYTDQLKNSCFVISIPLT